MTANLTADLVPASEGTDTPSGVLTGMVTVDGVQYRVLVDESITYQQPNTWNVTLARTSDGVCTWFTFPKGEDYRASRFYNIPNRDGGIDHPRTFDGACVAAIAWRLA